MNIKQIIKNINTIKEKSTKRQVKKYKLELMKKVILRLELFSHCDECNELLSEFRTVIKDMNKENLSDYYKKYNLVLKKSLSHLQKGHNLTPKGHYTGLYTTFGVSFGLIFGSILGLIWGTLFSDSLEQGKSISTYFFSAGSIGLSIGAATGLSIGSNKDKRAEKDGLII